MALFNEEIISYELSYRPILEPVLVMAKKAIKYQTTINPTVLHPNQGWHHQEVPD
jgi:hypothetical protein